MILVNVVYCPFTLLALLAFRIYRVFHCHTSKFAGGLGESETARKQIPMQIKNAVVAKNHRKKKPHKQQYINGLENILLKNDMYYRRCLKLLLEIIRQVNSGAAWNSLCFGGFLRYYISSKTATIQVQILEIPDYKEFHAVPLSSLLVIFWP